MLLSQLQVVTGQVATSLSRLAMLDTDSASRLRFRGPHLKNELLRILRDLSGTSTFPVLITRVVSVSGLKLSNTSTSSVSAPFVVALLRQQTPQKEKRLCAAADQGFLQILPFASFDLFCICNITSFSLFRTCNITALPAMQPAI